MTSLELLQKKAREKFFAGWGDLAVQMEANGFCDLFLKGLILHIYKQAVEDCKKALPEVSSIDRSETGDIKMNILRLERIRYSEGRNKYRAEVLQNLTALVPK